MGPEIQGLFWLVKVDLIFYSQRDVDLLWLSESPPNKLLTMVAFWVVDTTLTVG